MFERWRRYGHALFAAVATALVVVGLRSTWARAGVRLTEAGRCDLAIAHFVTVNCAGGGPPLARVPARTGVDVLGSADALLMAGAAVSFLALVVAPDRTLTKASTAGVGLATLLIAMFGVAVTLGPEMPFRHYLRHVSTGAQTPEPGVGVVLTAVGGVLLVLAAARGRHWRRIVALDATIAALAIGCLTLIESIPWPHPYGLGNVHHVPMNPFVGSPELVPVVVLGLGLLLVGGFLRSHWRSRHIPTASERQSHVFYG